MVLYLRWKRKNRLWLQTCPQTVVEAVFHIFEESFSEIFSIGNCIFRLLIVISLYTTNHTVYFQTGKAREDLWILEPFIKLSTPFSIDFFFSFCIGFLIVCPYSTMGHWKQVFNFFLSKIETFLPRTVKTNTSSKNIDIQKLNKIYWMFVLKRDCSKLQTKVSIYLYQNVG